MQIDHVNVRSGNIDALCSFYTHVLGLTKIDLVGSRRGFWLFADPDGPALLHVVASQEATFIDTPQIEHIGFRSSGLTSIQSRLNELGYAYSITLHSDLNLVRLNLRDPDRNRLHVDFPAAEYDVDTAEAGP